MKERSFGIIPLKRLKGGWHVLLVQMREGHWGFPKGHPDPGESPKDTAQRELFEETGLFVKEWISLPPFVERYIFSRRDQQVSKTVTYYVAKVEGKVEFDAVELTAARWVPVAQAEKLLTYQEIKAVYQQIIASLALLIFCE